MLDRGDVLLRRRDAEPLRLSRALNQGAAQEALSAAARLMAPLFTRKANNSVEDTAHAQLPWTRFLPTKERHAFLTEFLREFEACADLGDFTALGRVLVEWKNTAAVYAEGLGEDLKRPIGNVGERVRRPGR